MNGLDLALVKPEIYSTETLDSDKLCHNPLENFYVFSRLPLHLKVWGAPGGSGGSEKHIWKIFYRGDPKIGTPGTPRGSHGTKFFFEKFSLEKLIGNMLA